MRIENLKAMEWVLPLHRLSKEKKRDQFQKTTLDRETET
jgi:hypothetical protein